MQKILVAGLNCRPVALSAKKLGLEVYVVDYFGDIDLRAGVDGVFTIGKDYSAERLLGRTKRVAKRIQPDGLLLTSELGCNPEYVAELQENIRIIGNKTERVKRVRDWEHFFGMLKKMEIGYPKTFVVRRFNEIEDKCSELGFPLVTKPTHGSAGLMVEMCYNVLDVIKALKLHKEILIQEYIEGLDASISLLCSKDKIIPLSLNEQLIGIKELGQERRFGYCGNIAPLESKIEKECFEIGKKICKKFDLRGTVGIDIVLGDKPFVIEVNPRFHDTLECIERVYDINLVKLHLDACSNSLEIKNLNPKGFSCKGIIYANRNLKIVGDLTKVKDCADIMRDGTAIDMESPVCSVFGSGKSRDEAFDSMKQKVEEVERYSRGI